jgi:hypothetical protein
MAVDVVDSVCARPGTAFKQLWLAIVPLHESAYNGRGCERLRMADGTGSARCVCDRRVSCVNNAVAVAQSTLARRPSTMSKGTAGGRHQAGGRWPDADWPVVSTGLGLQVQRQELKPQSRRYCSSRLCTSTKHIAVMSQPSLTNFIVKRPWLKRWMTPLANWYSDAAGYRKLGLRSVAPAIAPLNNLDNH